MQNKDPDKKKGKGDLFWITSLGINLVLTTLVGLFIGYYIDKWLHTAPLMMFILFLLGGVAGFRQIIKELRKLDREEKQNSIK